LTELRTLITGIGTFFTAFRCGQYLISIKFTSFGLTHFITSQSIEVDHFTVRAYLIEADEGLASSGTAVFLDESANNTRFFLAELLVESMGGFEVLE
jgi:hypothetical protein